jgi:hypothetical protein
MGMMTSQSALKGWDSAGRPQGLLWLVRHLRETGFLIDATGTGRYLSH